MKNPVAKGLRTPRYRVRTVKPKKGKGSYGKESRQNGRQLLGKQEKEERDIHW